MAYVRCSVEEYDGDPRFHGVGAAALWLHVRLKLLAAQGNVTEAPAEVLEQAANFPLLRGVNLAQICWLSAVADGFLAQKSGQDVRTLRKNLELLRQKCIIFVGRSRDNVEVIGLVNYYKHQSDALRQRHKDAVEAAKESEGLFGGISNSISNKDKDKNKKAAAPPNVLEEAEATLDILRELTADKAGAGHGYWKDSPDAHKRSLDAITHYIQDFPAVDPLAVAKAFLAHYSFKPPKPSWNQASALRTFFVKALEFGRNLRPRPSKRQGKMEAFGDMIPPDGRKNG